MVELHDRALLDEVAALKDRPGADIVVRAASGWCTACSRPGSWTSSGCSCTPSSRVTGAAVPTAALRLDLVEARSFASGVALLTYRTTS